MFIFLRGENKKYIFKSKIVNDFFFLYSILNNKLEDCCFTKSL